MKSPCGINQYRLASFCGPKGEARRQWKEGPKRLLRSVGTKARRSLRSDVFRSEVELLRTAVYGPVRTVVWEGSGREARPYPD